MTTQFGERNRHFGAFRREPIRFDVGVGGSFKSNRPLKNHEYLENPDLRLKNFEWQQKSSAFRPNTQLSSRFMHDLKWKNNLYGQKIAENEDEYPPQMSSSTNPDKNLTVVNSTNAEKNMNMNYRESLSGNLVCPSFRNNVMSLSNRPFQTVRNSMFGSKLQLQEYSRAGEENFDDGFRRPTLMKVIRGRNSTMSSHQNIERCERGFSSFNDLQVTHFSKRGLDSFHESRMGFDGSQNWMNVKDVASSVSSIVSAKAQFMSLLENLHHSILCIAPNFVADAVRTEFDKVKEKLEDINEMSFAPTIQDMETASVVSHLSKFSTSRMPGQLPSASIVGNSTTLVTGKDILKTLTSKQRSSKDLNEPDKEVDDIFTLQSQNKLINDTDEDSALVFRKPKPSTKMKKIKKLSPIKKSPVSKSKAINLSDWYPVAEGSKLMFCGIDDKGGSVKTVAVRKRISSRKVLLFNGLECNLIGDPSHSIVLVLPTKIASLLKNGLTEKWRVFQKELYNCQSTIESSHAVEKVKSPRKITTPKKKSISPKNTKKKFPAKRSSPKESKLHTRSGRTVKAPTKFWIGAKNEETSAVDDLQTPEQNAKIVKTSSVEKSKTYSVKKSSEDNSKIVVEKSEKVKKSRGKTIRRSKSADSSLQKKRKSIEESSRIDESIHSPKTKKTQTKSQPMKRKREMVKEPEPVKRKRNKQEKLEKIEADTPKKVKTPPTITKKNKLQKEEKIGTVSPKKVKTPPTITKTRKTKQKITKVTVNNKKSPSKTKKGGKTKKAESFVAAETTLDFQDVDLELDDIKVPEVSRNVSKPQLSRSQLRLISMETPPLKYFNNNLKLLQTTTPVRSPDWCISQRTQSEVKQFQRRREECHRKKTEVTYKKTTIKREIKKNSDSKDLRSVLEWVADKNVESPQWKSKVLQYVIPSRKQMEEEEEEEEEEEMFEE